MDDYQDYYKELYNQQVKLELTCKRPDKQEFTRRSYSSRLRP